MGRSAELIKYAWRGKIERKGHGNIKQEKYFHQLLEGFLPQHPWCLKEITDGFLLRGLLKINIKTLK